mmetsp:Transcript_18211/g.38845  ORF Transcript_18211/g.38845 Transcript_18211/m.38845 type:complete len:400 (-) Transcript_18211:8-1207(-)
MMVMETWVMNTILVFSGGGAESPLGNAAILRLFRLLRLSRLARMLKTLPELMILIKGMTSAMRSVFFVMCLLVIVLYIFAIAFVQLSEGTTFGEKYFPNVVSAMYYLLIHGVFLDSLCPVTNWIKSESTVCLMLFFFFILMGALTVMNMLIGVLCEVVSEVAATEKEDMMVSLVTSKMERIVGQLDEDGDLRISKAEFASILEVPEAVFALKGVGVDPVAIVDFADFIFDEDDEETNTFGSISFEEFMSVVLKFRGSNVATVKDMIDLRKFIMQSLAHAEATLMDETKVTTKQKLRRGLSSVGKKVMNQQEVATVATGAFTDILLGKSRQGAAERSDEDTEDEALRRLQVKTTAVEELLSTVMAEVRQLGQRLPPEAAKGEECLGRRTSSAEEVMSSLS